jgi:hypothetical protein
MCVKLVIYKDYAEMHGQENKIYDHITNDFDLVSSFNIIRVCCEIQVSMLFCFSGVLVMYRISLVGMFTQHINLLHLVLLVYFCC